MRSPVSSPCLGWPQPQATAAAAPADLPLLAGLCIWHVRLLKSPKTILLQVIFFEVFLPYLALLRLAAERILLSLFAFRLGCFSSIFSETLKKKKLDTLFGLLKLLLKVY